MKIIRIQGAENKNIPYLFNKVMPIARDFGCGGRYDLQEGNVKIKIWSDKLLESAKAALNELKIKFTEGEE